MVCLTADTPIPAAPKPNMIKAVINEPIRPARLGFFLSVEAKRRLSSVDLTLFFFLLNGQIFMSY
jgi:hypothetical protein